MSKYDLAGAHVLNKFIWAGLQAEFAMSKADYNNLTPIIPTQQVPVFTEMGSQKPFIVYSYTTVGYTTDIWNRTEQMSYVIYSDVEADLRRIGNYLVDLLHRFDDTAQEVNDYLRLNHPNTDEAKFDFKWINVIQGIGAEPYTSEDGRSAAMIVIRYNYLLEENDCSMRV